jgi:hypothetical protein
VEVFKYAKSSASLRLVNRGRKPFGSKELLTIGNRPVFAPAEIDRHVVHSICMNYYEIFVARLRSDARRIKMAELYS